MEKGKGKVKDTNGKKGQTIREKEKNARAQGRSGDGGGAITKIGDGGGKQLLERKTVWKQVLENPFMLELEWPFIPPVLRSSLLQHILALLGPQPLPAPDTDLNPPSLSTPGAATTTTTSTSMSMSVAEYREWRRSAKRGHLDEEGNFKNKNKNKGKSDKDDSKEAKKGKGKDDKQQDNKQKEKESRNNNRNKKRKRPGLGEGDKRDGVDGKDSGEGKKNDQGGGNGHGGGNQRSNKKTKTKATAQQNQGVDVDINMRMDEHAKDVEVVNDSDMQHCEGIETENTTDDNVPNTKPPPSSFQPSTHLLSLRSGRSLRIPDQIDHQPKNSSKMSKGTTSTSPAPTTSSFSAPPPPPVLNHLVIGINSITKRMEDLIKFGRRELGWKDLGPEDGGGGGGKKKEVGVEGEKRMGNGRRGKRGSGEKKGNKKGKGKQTPKPENTLDPKFDIEIEKAQISAAYNYQPLWLRMKMKRKVHEEKMNSIGKKREKAERKMRVVDNLGIKIDRPSFRYLTGGLRPLEGGMKKAEEERREMEKEGKEKVEKEKAERGEQKEGTGGNGDEVVMDEDNKNATEADQPTASTSQNPQQANPTSSQPRPSSSTTPFNLTSHPPAPAPAPAPPVRSSGISFNPSSIPAHFFQQGFFFIPGSAFQADGNYQSEPPSPSSSSSTTPGILPESLQPIPTSDPFLKKLYAPNLSGNMRRWQRRKLWKAAREARLKKKRRKIREIVKTRRISNRLRRRERSRYRRFVENMKAKQESKNLDQKQQVESLILQGQRVIGIEKWDALDEQGRMKVMWESKYRRKAPDLPGEQQREKKSHEERETEIPSSAPSSPPKPLSVIFVCKPDINPPGLVGHLPSLVASWNGVVDGIRRKRSRGEDKEYRRRNERKSGGDDAHQQDKGVNENEKETQKDDNKASTSKTTTDTKEAAMDVDACNGGNKLRWKANGKEEKQVRTLASDSGIAGEMNLTPRIPTLEDAQTLLVQLPPAAEKELSQSLGIKTAAVVGFDVDTPKLSSILSLLSSHSIHPPTASWLRPNLPFDKHPTLEDIGNVWTDSDPDSNDNEDEEWVDFLASSGAPTVNNSDPGSYVPTYIKHLKTSQPMSMKAAKDQRKQKRVEMKTKKRDRKEQVEKKMKKEAKDEKKQKKKEQETAAGK